MAKVYDALKQVEAERSRRLQAQAVPAPARVGERPDATLWRRFSGRFAVRNGDADEAVVSARAVRERMDTIISRLDVFENLASERLPEIERNLLQLLESRIDAVEREVGASVSALSHQMRRDVQVLNKRVTMLFGAVMVLLAVILLRG